MVKIFKALSIEELEKQVNDFEIEYERVFDFSEHSISHADGSYIMCVTISNKWFI